MRRKPQTFLIVWKKPLINGQRNSVLEWEDSKLILKQCIYTKFKARALPYQMSEQITKLEQLK